MYTIREDFEGRVNVSHRRIYKQLRENIRRQLPQFSVYAENDYKALLLCGGPTLSEHVREIKTKRTKGWKLITVNNTHEWAIDHGMTPSMQVILDARALNARFVKRPQKDCRYLICSQAHADVFAALEGHDVHIWHAGASSRTEKKILDGYYNGRWVTVLGGTSVGTRAIGAAVMAGIRQIDVYGLDCCLLNKAHHAYSQPENDMEIVSKVRVGRRIFRCHGWMIKQADEVLQMAEFLPEGLKLRINGRGMMAYIFEQTAKQSRPPRMTVLETERVT